MRHNGTSRYQLITVILVTGAALALGACGGDPKNAEAVGASSTTASQGSSYSTQAFIVPFDVTVPDLFPTEATTDTANFVTWETATASDPAVRFLVPVDVYVPGETEATPPPADYLTYLLGQSEDGATFSDQSETTVDGMPATLVTVTVKDSLDGSLGCPAEDVVAEECYGLQPDLTLRMAVIDAGDSTLLAWLRHAGTEETGDATGEFAAFEDMLASVSFRDESPVTTEAPAAVATALDGVWTTSVTEDELASSPLLYEPDEVNDQNWGDLTFTFDKGDFTYTQENAKASYESAGTFTVDGDTVELNLDNTEHFVMRWNIDGDTLTFERDDAWGSHPRRSSSIRGRGRAESNGLKQTQARMRRGEPGRQRPGTALSALIGIRCGRRRDPAHHRIGSADCRLAGHGIEPFGCFVPRSARRWPSGRARPPHREDPAGGGMGRRHPHRPDRRVRPLGDLVGHRHGHQSRCRSGHPSVSDGSPLVPSLDRG